MGDKLRWGILGCAGIAEKQMIPGILASDNGTVAAVASRDREKARAMAARFRVETAHDSYEALLADPGIDAVYIPLPNTLHAEWAIRAAQAGKHILCEKPAAMNAAEAERMAEAAQAHGVLLAEAFMYRHHERWDRVLAMVRSGEIGELTGIHATFTYNMAGQKQNIRFQSAAGGGALYDVGCYCLHSARLITGREPIAITGHSRFDGDDPLIDLWTRGLAEFPGGVSLSFDCGMCVESRAEVEILGTQGRLFLRDAYNCSKNGTSMTVTLGGQTREEQFGPSDPFRNQAETFARAVLDGTPFPHPFADAVRNMKALEAARSAIRSRSRVVLV